MENDQIRALLQEPLIEAIRETNRCLYLWNAKREKYERSFTNRKELIGLLKTWLCKTGVRKIIGYHETNMMTGPHVYLQLDESHCWIEKWDASRPFMSYSSASSIAKIIDEIDLYELRYQAPLIPNWSNHKYCHQSTLEEQIRNVNFSSIENIKYGN